MTRDDVLRMAQEADLDWLGPDTHCRAPYLTATIEELERFAALVAQAEREACAKVCDKIENGYNLMERDQYPYERTPPWSVANHCADNIRARAVDQPSPEEK